MAEQVPVKGDRDYDPARRPASELTRTQARRLTDKIAAGIEHVWELLSEAQDKKAWAALGYGSWDQYVKTEFGLSRGQSYRLLDQAKVIGELEAAAELPAGAVARARDTEPPSARAAADVKTVLPQVAEKVRERTKDKPAEERPAIIAEVVEEERKARTPEPIDLTDMNRAQRVAGAAAAGAWSIDELVIMLSNRKPPEARIVPAAAWGKFVRWVEQASAVRAPTLPAAGGVSPSDCKHPANRRLGDQCAACETKVKAGR